MRQSISRDSWLTTSAIALAVAVCPGTRYAESEQEISPAETAQEIAAEIATAQTANGPFSVELLDPLRALALLHDENGNSVLADALRERALQVVRANYGLRSLEQAPILERRIESERERGNAAGAWDLEQSLLTLAEHHPDDVRTVDIHRMVAEERLEMLERYLSGSFQPEIVLGCYYSPYRNPHYGTCHSGSRGTAARGILADALGRYQDAIDVLLRNGLFASREIRDLEREIVLSSYEHGSYRAGRQSLRRSMAYAHLKRAPVEAVLEHATHVGDWDLLFGDHPLAMKIYEQTLDALVSQGVDTATIDALFAPDPPIMLPSFLPNPLVSQADGPLSEYVDVAFEVSKYGRGRKVEVLAATPLARGADIEELTTRIVRSRFRPRLQDGEFANTRAVVRYYFPPAE